MTNRMDLLELIAELLAERLGAKKVSGRPDGVLVVSGSSEAFLIQAMTVDAPEGIDPADFGDDLVDFVFGLIAAGEGREIKRGLRGLERAAGKSREPSRITLDSDEKAREERESAQRLGAEADGRGDLLAPRRRVLTGRGGCVVLGETQLAQRGEIGFGEAQRGGRESSGAGLRARRADVGEARRGGAVEDVAIGQLAGAGRGEEVRRGEVLDAGSGTMGGAGELEIEQRAREESGERNQEPAERQGGHISYASHRRFPHNADFAVESGAWRNAFCPVCFGDSRAADAQAAGFRRVPQPRGHGWRRAALAAVVENAD